jgi:DNA repair exonuclease SbcCD ATPase subunit
MDKFEKYVIDHHNEFDVYEPSPDLWNGVRRTVAIKPNRYVWLWKAAVVLIIFGASYWANSYIGINKRMAGKHTSINQSIPELAEAEKYYSGLIQTKLTELQNTLSSYPDIKKDLHKDLAELDKAYSDLKKDLKDNVSNEEVVDAMIQNYRLKLKLLEQIQVELKGQNNTNTKTPSHEL